MSTVLDKFKESINNNNLICTKEELDEYLNYGFLFKQGKDYYDRSFNKITIKNPCSFNISFEYYLDNGLLLSKKEHCKKIYYMTLNSFNNYKSKGYVVTKGNNSYFRIYNNDEWLISIIDKVG